MNIYVPGIVEVMRQQRTNTEKLLKQSRSRQSQKKKPLMPYKSTETGVKKK